MDLNELPPEFDFDFLDDNNEVNEDANTLNPSFCTQPDSPRLNVPTISEARLSLENAALEDTEHDLRQASQDVLENTIIAGEATESVVAADDDLRDVVAADDDLRDADADEVWSTPPMSG